MSKGLQTKDFITVGIFTAIYFVLFYAGGMLGFIPLLFGLIPLILPIIAGVPFMLFLTRVKSFGMITIMGILLGLLMTLGGHTFFPVISGALFGFIADLIIKKGNFSSKKLSILSHSVFSLWILGMLAPFWFMKGSFEKQLLDSMGVEYARASMVVFDKLSIFFPIMALAGGFIGAIFGLRMLQKHFNKAGIA